MLSEGHAVPIVYAACADLGVFMGKKIGDTKAPNLRPMTRDDAMQLRAIDSPIDGHPNPQVGFPFFDAATGSLGQGLSIAAGPRVGRQDRLRRPHRLLHHRRRREPRGADLGGVRLHRRPRPHERRADLQLQQFGAERLRQPAAEQRGGGGEAGGLRVHRAPDRRARPRGNQACAGRAAGGPQRQPADGDRRRDDQGVGRGRRAGHRQARQAGERGRPEKRPGRARQNGRGFGR